jgi:hypothetical protein
MLGSFAAGLLALAGTLEARAGVALVSRTELGGAEGAWIGHASDLAWLGAPARLAVLDPDGEPPGGSRLFELDLSGATPPRSLELGSVTEEGSGLAYHPERDIFFVTDDDALRLHELDRSGRRLATVDLAELGARDPEGVAYAPGLDRLFVADGRARRVLELTRAGELLAKLDLEPLGVESAEGIAYDPASGNLLVVADDEEPTLFEVTRAGELVGAYDLLALGALRPRGVTLAPPREGWPAGTRRAYVADALNEDDPGGRILELALRHRPAGARVVTSLVGDVDGFGFRGDEPGFAFGDLDRNGLLEPGERLPVAPTGALPDNREPGDDPATDSGFEVSGTRPLVLQHALALGGATPSWARVTLVVGGARALAGHRNLVRADGWLVGEVIPTRKERVHAGMIGASVLELPPPALRELADGRLRLEIARQPGSGSDVLMVDYCRLEVALGGGGRRGEES